MLRNKPVRPSSREATIKPRRSISYFLPRRDNRIFLTNKQTMKKTLQESFFLRLDSSRCRRPRSLTLRPALHIQQRVNISIWVAQCLGEFVPDKGSQRRRSASLIHVGGSSVFQTLADHGGVSRRNANTPHIMKMNAATTFNYSLPLALWRAARACG